MTNYITLRKEKRGSKVIALISINYLKINRLVKNEALIKASQAVLENKLDSVVK